MNDLAMHVDHRSVPFARTRLNALCECDGPTVCIAASCQPSDRATRDARAPVSRNENVDVAVKARAGKRVDEFGELKAFEQQHVDSGVTPCAKERNDLALDALMPAERRDVVGDVATSEPGRSRKRGVAVRRQSRRAKNLDRRRLAVAEQPGRQTRWNWSWRVCDACRAPRRRRL